MDGLVWMQNFIDNFIEKAEKTKEKMEIQKALSPHKHAIDHVSQN